MSRTLFVSPLFKYIATAARDTSDLVRRQAAPVAILALFLTVYTCEASSRTRLWDIDVSKLIGEAASSVIPEPIWGLAFSPDETQIAIAFGQHWTADPRIGSGHVVVVAVTEPKTVLHRFDVDASPGFALPGNLIWSPSGQRLAVMSRIFSLEGKLVCGLADEFRFAGFLSEDRTVIYNWYTRSGPTTGIEVRRQDCTTESAWEDNLERAVATCPSAGLVAVRRPSPGSGDPPGSPIVIDFVTYPGRVTAHPWTGNDEATSGGVVFADSCRVVCAGKLRGDSKGYYATCWDIETGAATVEKTTVTLADRPSFDAVAEDWVASTVYKWSCLEGKLWVFLDLDGCFAKLKRRLIWNVRTGEDVVSWNPAEQKVEMPGSVHKPVSEASAFTLSSKRNFMAEGGSGRVQVYRLQ